MKSLQLALLMLVPTFFKKGFVEESFTSLIFFKNKVNAASFSDYCYKSGVK